MFVIHISMISSEGHKRRKSEEISIGLIGKNIASLPKIVQLCAHCAQPPPVCP